MSAISDYYAKEKAHRAEQDKAIDGLVQDQKTQEDLIAKLQSSQGEVTPEDQALIDELQALTATQTAKLKALDAKVPPPLPTE